MTRYDRSLMTRYGIATDGDVNEPDAELEHAWCVANRQRRIALAWRLCAALGWVASLALVGYMWFSYWMY